MDVALALIILTLMATSTTSARHNVSKIMSENGCKAYAETLQGTDAEVTFLQQVEGGLTLFCPEDKASIKFLLVYHNLSYNGRNDLLNFHGIPSYKSLSTLRVISGSMMHTLAGDMDDPTSFYIKVETEQEDVSLNTGVMSASIMRTIMARPLTKVLLPRELFEAKLPLAPHISPTYTSDYDQVATKDDYKDWVIMVFAVIWLVLVPIGLVVVIVNYNSDMKLN